MKRIAVIKMFNSKLHQKNNSYLSSNPKQFATIQ